jgi:hypothetical protein
MEDWFSKRPEGTKSSHSDLGVMKSFKYHRNFVFVFKLRKRQKVVLVQAEFVISSKCNVNSSALPYKISVHLHRSLKLVLNNKTVAPVL